MSQQEEVETVDIAAVQYKGKIYTGARHVDIIVQPLEEYGHFPVGYVAGFLTSKGRFVNRKEAAQLAFTAGQTPQQEAFLYSEDIY